MTTKLVLSLLVAGTGSSYPLKTAKTWQTYLQTRSALDFAEINNSHLQMDLRTPIMHLLNIRHILNPPISELAILFDVSRQAIYKWLSEESIPETEKSERIVELSKIADNFKEADIHRGGALLNMKLFAGQSLFDLLKARKPHKMELKALIDEAKAMETAYQRSGLMQSNAKSTNDWLSSISIPAFREE